MNLVGKYDNILPISSPSVSYNNYYEGSNKGSIHLNCQGVFKNIFIYYDGDISFDQYDLDYSMFKISWNPKKKLITVRNIIKSKMKDDLLVSYFGIMNEINKVLMSGWGKGSISADIINTDPKLKDDNNVLGECGIILKESNQKNNKKNQIFTNKQNKREDTSIFELENKLPNSYRNSTNLNKSLSEMCVNCIHYRKHRNYKKSGVCHKFNANVLAEGLCNNWKKARVIKYVI